MPEYSERFKEDVLRSAAGKSQRTIAEKMRVSQTTVSNMQYGRIPADLELVRRFALAVGEDPDAWVRRARLYREEAHLRDLGYLSDDAVKEILAVMEREEERHRR